MFRFIRTQYLDTERRWDQGEAAKAMEKGEIHIT